jgi:hypothetical protein
MYGQKYDDDKRPFAFEDLEGKPEPERWGPKYSKPTKARRVNDETNIPTNCASGQKGDFDAKKHRAKMAAEFRALAEADKRAWANGFDRPCAFGKYETIVDVYEAAMAAKRARLAALMRQAA